MLIFIIITVNLLSWNVTCRVVKETRWRSGAVAQLRNGEVAPNRSTKLLQYTQLYEENLVVDSGG